MRKRVDATTRTPEPSIIGTLRGSRATESQERPQSSPACAFIRLWEGPSRESSAAAPERRALTRPAASRPPTHHRAVPSPGRPIDAPNESTNRPRSSGLIWCETVMLRCFRPFRLRSPEPRCRTRGALRVSSLSVSSPWLLPLGALYWLVPATTLAASDLDGTWNASAARTQWRLGNWPDACGKPPTGHDSPGGSAEVHRVGSELELRGPGLVHTTGVCPQRKRPLERASHASGAQAWTTQCRRGPPDEMWLRTQVSATPDQIRVDETGKYRFARGGKSCTASSRRVQVLSRTTPIAAVPVSSTQKGLNGPGVAKAAKREGFDFGLAVEDPVEAEAAGTPQAAKTTSGTQQAPAAAPASAQVQGLADVRPTGSAPIVTTEPTSVVGSAPALGPDTTATRRRNFLLLASSIALLLGALGVFQLRRSATARRLDASRSPQNS